MLVTFEEDVGGYMKRDGDPSSSSSLLSAQEGGQWVMKTPADYVRRHFQRQRQREAEQRIAERRRRREDGKSSDDSEVSTDSQESDISRRRGGANPASVSCLGFKRVLVLPKS